MIFRRIKAHIEKENWFAVFIDFLIVVVGVFIGIQVANWNDARINDARAADFSQRLTLDIHREQENVKSIYDYLIIVRAEALKVHDSLTGREPLSDAALLGAIFRATQNMWYTRERSTFDEIIAAGALELIADRKLRKLAIQYFNSETLNSLRQDGRQLQYTQVISELLPPRIHLALRDNCGDKTVESAYGGNPLFSLAYTCEFSWPEASELRSVVSDIKGQAGMLPLIRSRISQIDNLLANISSEFFVTQYQAIDKAETP